MVVGLTFQPHFRDEENSGFDFYAYEALSSPSGRTERDGGRDHHRFGHSVLAKCPGDRILEVLIGI